MTHEIKQRIEQIGRGEVPEGYTSTPAGIFPKDWSYAKLSDISEIITETAGERAIETVSISAGIGFVNQAQKFGKELSGNQYSKYNVLHRGDFAYNKGNSNRYPQGCTYMLKDRDEAAVPNVFECFRVRTGVPEYYEQLFIHGFINKQLARLINHGVRDDGLLNLTDKDFYSVSLPVPSISEQQRIAKILTDYDRVIELKQKLVDEFKKLKKACLAKMFPQEGETVPEIRFPGFTASWKKCKVLDVANRFDNQRIPVASNLRVPGTTPYYGANGIQDYVEGFTHEGEYVLIAEDGANDFINYPVRYVNGRIWVNNHAHVLQSKSGVTDNRFLAYLLSQSDIGSLLVGGGRAKLNAEVMMGMEIKLPNIQEQILIGRYLSLLDDLVALHQRELEKEQKKKKALMQLLLTGIVRTPQ